MALHGESEPSTSSADTQQVVDENATIAGAENSPIDVEKEGNRRRKYRSFDLSFKLRVVQYAKAHTKAAAAKVFNIDRQRVIKWCQKQKEITATQAHAQNAKQKRYIGLRQKSGLSGYGGRIVCLD
jgi:hypothetical protein